MSSSKQPTETHGIFGALSLKVLSQSILFPILQVLSLGNMASGFVFYGIPVYTNMYISVF